MTQTCTINDKTLSTDNRDLTVAVASHLLAINYMQRAYADNVLTPAEYDNILKLTHLTHNKSQVESPIDLSRITNVDDYFNMSIIRANTIIEKIMSDCDPSFFKSIKDTILDNHESYRTAVLDEMGKISVPLSIKLDRPTFIGVQNSL